jgi:two-component system response regulator YesN
MSLAYKAVIIDDEAWTRDTIKRIGHWQKYGFRIAGEAADGISGIACIKTLSPDLIVTDMRMPGLDGAGMLKIMQEENIHSKVIVISGYDDFHYTKQALSSKVMDYLLKPIKEDEFNALLDKCAAELRNSEVTNLKRGTSLVGYVEKKWLDEYRKVREDFRNCMEGLSLRGLTLSADQLLRKISMAAIGESKLRILVKVNYDLLRIIEEAAITRELDLNNDFTESEISFTIKETTTADDLTKHYLNVGQQIIERVEEINLKKNRVDISAMKEYMLINYGENITLGAMADKYHVSKEYLSSLFKKETGKTFSEHLIGIRMEKAKKLIVEYDLPIQKVAEMTGYVDIAHFYKMFKRYFGTSPGRIREDE